MSFSLSDSTSEVVTAWNRPSRARLRLLNLRMEGVKAPRRASGCLYPSKLVLTLCCLGFTESGCVTRSRYPDVVLDASSVDVLVEAALRVARIERRRVALENVEAVGCARIARINARYEG